MSKVARAEALLNEHFVPYKSAGLSNGGDVIIEVNAATTIARENFKTRLEIIGFVNVRHYTEMTPDGPYTTIVFDLPEPTLAQAFDTLATSTAAFHERFETESHSDLYHAWLVMWEEVKEVEFEVMKSYRENRNMELAKEMADLLVTMLGVARFAGISESDLAAAMLEVAAKNDAKTHENCVWKNGKVTRREKLEGGG